MAWHSSPPSLTRKRSDIVERARAGGIVPDPVRHRLLDGARRGWRVVIDDKLHTAAVHGDDPISRCQPFARSLSRPVLSRGCGCRVVRPDRGAGEPEGYHSAVRFTVSEHQPPAVAGGYRLGDPEPEPAAGPDISITVKVAGKLAGLSEAAAGIADADLDRVAGVVRGEGDGPAGRGVPQALSMRLSRTCRTRIWSRYAATTGASTTRVIWCASARARLAAAAYSSSRRTSCRARLAGIRPSRVSGQGQQVVGQADDLCVPRIASTALTSRVARPAPARDDHRSCACSSPSSSSRG